MNLLKKRFREQRHSSEQRGIAFLLTFDEWITVWTESGHLHERGKAPGQYVMARYGDCGPYAVGNVKIITMKANIQEGSRGFGNSGIGRPHDLATRRKISSSNMGRPATRGTLGFRHTQETKDRISRAKLGVKLGPRRRKV